MTVCDGAQRRRAIRVHPMNRNVIGMTMSAFSTDLLTYVRGSKSVGDCLHPYSERAAIHSAGKRGRGRREGGSCG